MMDYLLSCYLILQGYKINGDTVACLFFHQYNYMIKNTFQNKELLLRYDDIIKKFGLELDFITTIIRFLNHFQPTILIENFCDILYEKLKQGNLKINNSSGRSILSFLLKNITLLIKSKKLDKIQNIADFLVGNKIDSAIKFQELIYKMKNLPS